MTAARVVLSMRITQAAGYDEARDSISHDWITCLQGWGLEPIPFPNGLGNPLGVLDRFSPDLIILTGGDDPGMDTPRDATERILLDYTAEKNKPLLGVCRGLQAINLHFGGGLDGVAGHVAAQHHVTTSGSFADIYGARATVNSFHDTGVPPHALADDLVAAAVDDAGNVEALHHVSLPLAAVMWHPERSGAPAADHILVRRLIEEGAFWS